MHQTYHPMTRFPLLLAAAGVLLVAMVAVTEASTNTLFIPTTTFEENPHDISGSESGCDQRWKDQESLSDCIMYIMNELVSPTQGEFDKPVCCMELKNLGEECLCPGIKMMLDRPFLGTLIGKDKMGQFISKAQNLPTECNLTSQTCLVNMAI